MTAERSPLAGYGDRLADVATRSATSLDVAEIPQRKQVNLRISETGQNRWEHVLGRPLPVAPNTLVDWPGGWIGWLGPDEWLLATSGEVTPLIADLRVAAGDEPISITDVSAARTTLRISGPATRELLAHGCALDLDARRLPAGSCVQTRLAQANVVIAAPTSQPDFAGAPVFEVLVRASFARYLADWLLDAAAEFFTA